MFKHLKASTIESADKETRSRVISEARKKIIEYQTLQSSDTQQAQIIFFYLFENRWDWQDVNTENQMAALDLLKLLCNPEVQKLADFDTENAGKMLKRFIDFSECISSDCIESDFDLCVTKQELDPGRALILYNDYSKKIAMHHCDKEYDKSTLQSVV